VKGLLLPPERIRLLSAQYDNTAALSANSGTQTFGLTYTVPANTIQTGVVLRVSLGMQLSSSASTLPNVSFTVRLGGTNIVTQTANAPTASLTTRGFGLVLLIAGTAAPGGSVAVSTEFLGTHTWEGNIAGVAGGMNLTAQPVSAIATNGSLLIDVQYTTTNSTGGNSAALRQMIVEQIGP
jgi:hypothetical protein